MKPLLSRRILIAVTLGALFFFILSIVLLALMLGFVRLIDYKLAESLAIVPGSAVYDNWVSPSSTIMFTLYLFNLTNPQETLAGEKPVIREIGPYVYREIRNRTNIRWNKKGDQSMVSFYQRVTYFHDTEAPGADPSKDIVTSVRLPVATLAASDISHIDYMMLALLTTPSLFVTKTVEEYIWGYVDEITEACNLASEEKCPSPKVGLMLESNGTDQGPYLIDTGFRDIQNVGQVLSFRNKSKMDYWSNPEANIIKGTDGSSFAPGLKLNSTLHLFSGDLCQSFVFQVTGESYPTNSDKLKVYSVAAQREEPSCAIGSPGPECAPEGLMDLSACKRRGETAPPIYSSLPRFFRADANLTQPFDGLPRPDEDCCGTRVFVEPKTGLVLEAYKRLQINMYLKPRELFSDVFKNITKPIYFPIAWFEERAAADAESLDRLYYSLFVRPAKGYSLLLYMFAFCVSVFLTSMALMIIHACTLIRPPNADKTVKIMPIKYIAVPSSPEQANKGVELH